MRLCHVCYNRYLQKKNKSEVEKIISFKIEVIIRIMYWKSKTHLTPVCNSWSIFRKGGTKFVPSETGLHIVDFLLTEPRTYSMKGKCEGMFLHCPPFALGSFPSYMSQLYICSSKLMVLTEHQGSGSFAF